MRTDHLPAGSSSAVRPPAVRMPEAHSPSGQPLGAGPPSGRPTIGYVLKMYPRFSETFVVSEILAREARGESLVIFSLRPSTDTRFHPELARVQAPVIHVPRPSSAHGWWETWRTAGADPATAAGLVTALPALLEAAHDDAGQAVALAALARAHGVTHLHAHFASVATRVARLTGLIAGLPYSFTAHAKDIFHEDVDPELLRTALAGAHHAVTISEYNMAHLRSRFPDECGRLHLVRNGLELDRFEYAPRPAPAVPARVLAVGRLVEKKGFRHLIDAVDRLRAAGEEVTADIVGDGPLREELEADIAVRGLGGAVSLLGPRTQEEVVRLLGSHDVFAAPFVVGADGNADGLPTVLLEAMARGIRCVAADVTAVSEVIVTGETGWLVPSGDPAALARALAEAVHAGPSSLAQAERARVLVERRYDSRRQAAELAALVTEGSCGAESSPATVGERGRPAGTDGPSGRRGAEERIPA
jgi:glycosyltransferase involved in cell wall biosynthesis